MGDKVNTQSSLRLVYSASSTRNTRGNVGNVTRLTHVEIRARQGDTQQGGSSSYLTPHTSLTISLQASTMSTSHTQSRRTHCQPTGTITWQSEYICPGTKGSEAALSCSSSLCPPHWAPTLFSEPVSACGRAGGSNYLLTRQNPLPFV